MQKTVLFVALASVLVLATVVSGEVFFEENFDDGESTFPAGRG